MKKKVKCFKINVLDGSIDDVAIGGLRDYYEAIGNGCSLIEVGSLLADGDSVMVDEEGLLHENIGGFVLFDEYYKAVAILHGNGIVIGMTDEGDEQAPAISKAALRSRIGFASPEMIENIREKRLHTPPTIIIYRS
jgi:hypothetical protein